MYEKLKLICKLIQEYYETMEPYMELLGDGVSPITEGWYNSIEQVGVYLGLTEEQIDSCWNYEIEGNVSFTLNDGSEYIAYTIPQLVYAWEH